MSSISAAQKSVRFRLHPAERRIILLVVDALVAFIALLISIYAWGQKDWLDFSRTFLDERIPRWFYLLPFAWMILNVEMYDVHRAGRRWETVKGVAATAGIGIIVYAFVFFFSEKGSMPRWGVGIYVAAASVLMIAWRMFYISVFTAPEFLRRVLIVGAGRAGCTLTRVIRGIDPPPFSLIGLVDDDAGKLNTMVEGYPVIGSCYNLLGLIEKHRVSDVIIAISNDISAETFQALLQAEEEGVQVTTMPVVYEDLMGRVPIFLLRSDWILRSFVDEAHANIFYEIVKRLLDVLGGLVGLLVFALMVPTVGFIILLETGWPIFYTQRRLGKNGAEYQILKFRSMRELFDDDGKPLPDDIRVTRIGKLLRRSHLDEVPQFFNVLRGEMSLVGPRAERSELVNELQKKVPFYRARLFVKPGLTGWAQVNYGYAITIDETAVKLEYDLYYIKHRTLMLDMIILLRTIGTVVGFKGQ